MQARLHQRVWLRAASWLRCSSATWRTRPGWRPSGGRWPGCWPSTAVAEREERVGCRVQGTRGLLSGSRACRASSLLVGMGSGGGVACDGLCGLQDAHVWHTCWESALHTARTCACVQEVVGSAGMMLPCRVGMLWVLQWRLRWLGIACAA